MAQREIRPRVPDGYRDRLLRLAARLDDGAGDLFCARFDPRDPSVAHNARMDADHLMRDVAHELRQLR